MAERLLSEEPPLDELTYDRKPRRNRARTRAGEPQHGPRLKHDDEPQHGRGLAHDGELADDAALTERIDSFFEDYVRDLEEDAEFARSLPPDEHDLFSAHEEETVPATLENGPNERYIVGAVQIALPEYWVTGNGCLYWGRGYHDCAAPDLAVFDCPPVEHPPRVWLAWSDPPVLLVGELGSESNLPKDTRHNLRHYEQDLKVPEYLFAYLTPRRRLKRLWIARLQEDGTYEKTYADRNGRVTSQQFNISFGWDENYVFRVYREDGSVVLSHEEAAARAEEEERLRKEEERERRRAERQLQREARRREQAEREAEETRRLLAEREQELAEREQELAELRARWKRMHPENGAEIDR